MNKLAVDGKTFTFIDEGPDSASIGEASPSSVGSPAPEQAVGRSTAQPAAGEPSIDESHGEPPIVLLHGFPLHNGIWADVAARLKPFHRVIRPNLRGFGTFTSDEPFDMDALAGDLRVLLRGLGIDQFILAGLSMGGYVALSYMDQWADELLAVALVNSRTSSDSAEARASRDAMAETARRRGTPTVVASMHSKMLAPHAYQNLPVESETLLRIMLDTPATTIRHALRAMRDRKDYTRIFEQFSRPLLVVAGEEDQIVSGDETRRLCELHPHCQLEMLAGCGHMSPLESPERVANSMLELSRSVKRASLWN
jgi:pimeloyl-ACP methyl ester carboxylesterase